MMVKYTHDKAIGEPVNQHHIRLIIKYLFGHYGALFYGHMKTIIAGSRDNVGPEHLFEAFDIIDYEITQVICGCARGADTIGKAWADLEGIPCLEMPADWDLHGKKAGSIRNEEMALEAEALIALWDGVSTGTANMINIAERLGLHVTVIYTQ